MKKFTVILISAVIVFAVAYTAVAVKNTNVSDTASTREAAYDEPDIPPGKYYLNGNTEEIYLEIISRDEISFAANDNELLDFFIPSYPDYGKCSDEEQQLIDEAINEHIQFWQDPRKYAVKTIFSDDVQYTYVAVKWVLDNDGKYLGLSEPVYLDPTTLTYCGCEFVLMP
ncbi:MAG: hypothetical protein NC120_13425 [Ruminococcus sp.]|nr:hypothetical protein [Ruminococcus sp.]